MLPNRDGMHGGISRIGQAALMERARMRGWNLLPAEAQSGPGGTDGEGPRLFGRTRKLDFVAKQSIFPALGNRYPVHLR